MEKITNWIYMVPREISVRDIMAAVPEKEVEIWEEIGVLEIELASGNSMDIEETAVHPKDEDTLQFTKENNIVSLFYVTLPAGEFQEASTIMKAIIKENGGFFCADTEGFAPKIQ